MCVADDTEGAMSKVSRGAGTYCTCVNCGQGRDIDVNER
jgi:hypothetical protein